jgi:hypothetical protein
VGEERPLKSLPTEGWREIDGVWHCLRCALIEAAPGKALVLA